MAYTIYLHTSPSGKRYVGLTARTVAERWGQHVALAKRGRGSVFHAAIRKYGAASFKTEILDVVFTAPGAARAEQLWITELQTWGPGGYNVTVGGDGATNPTPEARARLAKSTSLSWKDPAIRNARTVARRGHKLSAETRSRMARAKKGCTRSEEHRAKLSESVRAYHAARKARGV